MVLTNLSEREHLKLMTLEYNIESEGNFFSESIIQLFCRDEDGNRRTVEVEGFHPFFYITEEDYIENEHDLFQESMIRRIEAREGLTSKDNERNAALVETLEPPKETLEGTELVKIYAVLPEHVKKLKESGIFEDGTWEADVFFTNRFLIESGVKRGLTVPQGKDRIQYDELEATDEPPAVSPRMVTIDIEVWSGGKFPDTQDPKKPITAVTVHDTYDDEYRSAVLHPSSVAEGEAHSWPENPDWQLPDTVDECPVEVYHNEAQMLADINEWIIDKDPDLLTGWNSSRNEIGSGFDYPYWLNRCERINEWTYKDLSPTDSAFVTNRGSPVIGGREMFDMLQAYKKTQIHEKRSYALGYIAEEELGYGKEDVADLDEGWLHEPVEFMKYNVRDTEAVVEIERTKNVLEMYDHIRSIAGATYSEIADSNIGIIDMLFLREAGGSEIALPTSVKPDVQHYWGAYVFPPKSGKHKNVVYPDLSSLYPNLFRDMNASPETIIGFEEDLQNSEYTREDCHTIYVDTRDEDVKRSADEPERSELFVLKPEVKTSFVRETVQDLIDMKYEYKKDRYSDEAYEAVKRITNSVYGVMGDSISYGKGFRLFDWRIAEAITLAGRDVIKWTADEFESRVRSAGYSNAEIVAGDSVPAEEPVVVKRGNSVNVVEIRNVSVGDKVWSDDGFTEVKDVIKKPNRKKCYSIRSQTGLVHTTSDHGLLYEDGEEVTPEDVDIGEKLLHNDLTNVSMEQDASVSDNEAYLLGVFCAEGSAGCYETGTEWEDSKNQVKVSNQDAELLEKIKDYFESEYDFNMKIYDDRTSSNVHNLKPFGNEVGDISEMAAWLRRWCYTDSGEKRVPKRIFSAPQSAKESFLNGFHDGDGYIKNGNYEELKDYDEMWSKSPVLLQGIVLLLRDLDVEISLSWRSNHDSQYYRVRCPNFRRVDETTCREIDAYEYTGDYVYDLETENHHFAAGIGSMVVHNTDSCVLSLSEADGMEETLEVAHEAAEYVDMTYDDFMTERFNIEDDHMAVEIESYAESALFMNKKKRYAQWIRWDEGDYVDEVEVKGFELVRSDSAPITGRMQKEVIDLVLKNDEAKESVREYLKTGWEDVMNGNVDLEEIGKPSAIKSDIWTYGYSEQDDGSYNYYTPQPNIRGARYATAYIDGEDIETGKPLMFYVKDIDSNSDLPETYCYDNRLKADADNPKMFERDREVDAVAVEDIRNLPDAVNIDWEKMAAKTIRDPIEPIVNVLNWSFDDLISEGKQTGLSEYM